MDIYCVHVRRRNNINSITGMQAGSIERAGEIHSPASSLQIGAYNRIGTAGFARNTDDTSIYDRNFLC